MSTLRSSGKRVVPWFSMGEWTSVYEALYSDDTQVQHQGYEHLLSWKARCSTLPVGVECTLGIYQVLLQDKERFSSAPLSPLRDHDLRLFYSTAIMRFLNLILEVSNEEGAFTMYQKAEKQNIPEWLVNLRHGAAHGTSLPELSLLRAAAEFTLKWLHEYYWQGEAESSCDWVVTGNEVSASVAVENELRKILETWETLSLYRLTGFSTVHQIPDRELKNNLDDMQMELCKDGKRRPQNMINKQISVAMALVLRRLRTFMKQRSGSVDKRSLLADMLVDGNSLLPSEEVLQVIGPNVGEDQDTYQKLPPTLSTLWADMMLSLWEMEVIPTLVSKLIAVAADCKENGSRSNIAALWVRKLLLSCIKVREARRVRSALQSSGTLTSVYRTYTDPDINRTRKEIIQGVAISAVENQCGVFKEAYTWPLLPLPASLFSKDLLHQVLYPVSHYANFMLPSILELVSPPIPVHLSQKLHELVTIYNKVNLDSVRSTECVLYTVKDLLENNKETTEVVSESQSDGESEISVEQAQPAPVPSRWTKSQDYHEWASCPLGLLPWQRHEQQEDQNEYEQRQRQRYWSRLIVPGQWEAEKGCKVDDVHSEKEIFRPKSVLNVVKSGKVVKIQHSQKKPSLKLIDLYKETMKS